MERLRRIALGTARRMGIAISRYPSYFSLEHHLHDLLRDAEISLVIDVGAHHGEFRHLLRHECGYCVDIISFEPASAAFERLLQIPDPHWERYKLALGRSEGEATLQIYGSTSFNSVLTPSGFGADIFDLSRRGTEQMKVRRLDDVLSELAIDLTSQPSFIKIDTQGADRDVIAGAPIAMAGTQILQTEMSLLHIYEGAPTFLEYLAEVMDLGFDLTGLFPVTRDVRFRLVEIDCVLRRVPA